MWRNWIGCGKGSTLSFLRCYFLDWCDDSSSPLIQNTVTLNYKNTSLYYKTNKLTNILIDLNEKRELTQNIFEEDETMKERYFVEEDFEWMKSMIWGLLYEKLFAKGHNYRNLVNHLLESCILNRHNSIGQLFKQIYL